MEARLVGPIFNSLQCMGFSIGIHFFHSSEDSLIRFFISNGAGRIKKKHAFSNLESRESDRK